MKVDNAIILAAGFSSRLKPLTLETSKGLLKVKGEVLIERQIKQLRDAGIRDIYVITGYMAEQFQYLEEEFEVKIIHNPEYDIRNNHSSIWAARNVLGNSYICSVDNYFTENPFESEVDKAYYSVVFSEGETDEWCVAEDYGGYICSVSIGGSSSWYMYGHAMWSREFSKEFLDILESVYERSETRGKLWESILVENLDKLKLKTKKYSDGIIYEFDTLKELASFDDYYKSMI